MCQQDQRFSTAPLSSVRLRDAGPTPFLILSLCWVRTCSGKAVGVTLAYAVFASWGSLSGGTAAFRRRRAVPSPSRAGDPPGVRQEAETVAQLPEGRCGGVGLRGAPLKIALSVRYVLKCLFRLTRSIAYHIVLRHEERSIRETA